MTPAFSPFLALRYLVTRRINVLGALGVAFAVWAMLVVDGVFTGFVQDIRSDVHHSAPELLLTDLPHDTDYAPLRELLQRDQDIAAIAPRLRQFAMLQPRAGSPRARPQRSAEIEFDHTSSGFALLLGVDPLLEPDVVDLGGWLDRAPDELRRYGQKLPRSEVLDEADPARREYLRVTDEVDWRIRRRLGLPAEPHVEDHRTAWPGALLGSRRVYDLGLLREGEPFDIICASFPKADADGHAAMHTNSLVASFAGWFRSDNRWFDETMVLLPIETVRTLVGQDAMDPDSIELVTDVAIRPRAGLSAAGLVALQRRIEQQVQPLLPAGSAPCAVFDWQQQNSVFLDAVAREQVMMQLVLFVVMLVSAFVIYATLHMMVVQKVKDIGILAAVGGAPGGIGGVFLISGLVVGAVGTALGVVAGLLSARWLNPINEWVYDISDGRLELFPRSLFDLDGVPCHIEPSWVVSVALGALLLALLVAFLPARRASRMNPVTALSFE